MSVVHYHNINDLHEEQLEFQHSNAFHQIEIQLAQPYLSQHQKEIDMASDILNQPLTFTEFLTDNNTKLIKIEFSDSIDSIYTRSLSVDSNCCSDLAEFYSHPASLPTGVLTPIASPIDQSPIISSCGLPQTPPQDYHQLHTFSQHFHQILCNEEQSQQTNEFTTESTITNANRSTVLIRIVRNASHDLTI
ncbi:6831_t:CDS:2 [Ambispora gerdemannii]|uniref:6831_t:CDS:1 n=1 Tax=Ambispora gerdemannii TaxID=144530 RepID=A0A9N9FFG5_9GLOM|nr:6831_t:CDS:2 [Ambispora gerdemannii]